ncbi:YfcC family protein [Streptococcus himalayensis]|uniref:Arginine:ornithine antiporter n=1 Tax=Streptococcus himalayensis TaxID=1888195 RepID=A0A917A4S7_9STRE|nr:YfcC family protein [Streptococcus himalayensis]GGE25102.1 arginine:ornithine antiporter [Streptococcus himalayensis]
MDVQEKKKFKSPNTYVIIFFVLLFVAFLTWFIPGGEYSYDKSGRAIANSYRQINANRQGLWDVIMAPIIGMVGNDKVSGAITISLNVMLFGSFLEMMDATGAINIALKNVAKKCQKNYYVLITVLTFLMGIFGTVQGAYEEGFVYLLMFLPIILSLGLDTIVALMIVIFGTQAGCAASIVNPFSTGIASGIAGISPGEGIIFRTLAFFVLLSFCSAIICLYAKKVKAHPEISVQYFRKEKDIQEFAHDQGEEQTLDQNQKKVFVIFILTFTIMILSLIPWTSLNKEWTFFTDITEWANQNTVVSTILGSSLVPLGDWYFNEINGLLLVMTILSGYIMGYDIDKTIQILIRGAAALVSTAFIVPLARGIQVLMTNGSITATVLNATEKTLGSLPPAMFIFVCFLVYIILATFIPSSTGLAAATISIMAPLGIFAGISEANMVVIYNFALGFVKLLAPTSIIVMTCTQAVHVSYGAWIKATWKYAALYFSILILLLMLSLAII